MKSTQSHGRWTIYASTFFVCLFLGVASLAEAALSLSAMPIRGGNTLRFGRIVSSSENSKEVRLRITSTDGKQYQVFQRIIEPLRNERANTLRQGVLQAYGLIGSNSSGTLYLQNIESLSSSDQLLYTSSSGGESDSFTIVYTLDEQSIDASGNFLGKILYLVRPVGGSSQDTMTLNVSLQNEGQFKATVAGSSNNNAIHLSYEGLKRQSGFATVSFEGNLGSEVRIYQEAKRILKRDSLDEITEGVLKYSVSGSSAGLRQGQQLQDLSLKRTLLYSSNASQDEFVINYVLDPEAAEALEAGEFAGDVQYVIEQSGESQILDLELNVESPRIFELVVDFPQDGMKFSKLLPQSPPQIKEVAVHVRSNIGSPYIVTQKVVSLLANDQGDEIPKGKFNVKSERLDGNLGKLAFAEYEPVEEGDTPVFISDSDGSSVDFKVFYRLSSFTKMSPGDYSAAIVYSLEEK